MKYLILTILLAGCGPLSLEDRDMKPGDWQQAEKMCAPFGGVVTAGVLRRVRKNKVTSTTRRAVCADGTGSERREYP